MMVSKCVLLGIILISLATLVLSVRTIRDIKRIDKKFKEMQASNKRTKSVIPNKITDVQSIGVKNLLDGLIKRWEKAKQKFHREAEKDPEMVAEDWRQLEQEFESTKKGVELQMKRKGKDKGKKRGNGKENKNGKGKNKDKYTSRGLLAFDRTVRSISSFGKGNDNIVKKSKNLNFDVRILVDWMDDIIESNEKFETDCDELFSKKGATKSNDDVSDSSAE